MKRIKRIRHAYNWMLTHHPHVPDGIFFVVRCRNVNEADIESEYWRWQDGRTHK